MCAGSLIAGTSSSSQSPPDDEFETDSRGSLNSTPVPPREVFKAAILANAAAIIIAHNHPSGDPMPRPEDHHITRRLIRAGELLGINVLDHIIIGYGSYFSFHEADVLRRREMKLQVRDNRGRRRTCRGSAGSVSTPNKTVPREVSANGMGFGMLAKDIPACSGNGMSEQRSFKSGGTYHVPMGNALNEDLEPSITATSLPRESHEPGVSYVFVFSRRRDGRCSCHRRC
jgi:hypothetical protein